MELTPRRGATVGLLALVPVAAFVLLRGDAWASVALVNVLLIVGSLAVALRPVPDHGRDHGSDHDVAS
jgi:hypothetical protein